MLATLRKFLGQDEKFYDLLEGSAAEAQNSVLLLVQMLKRAPEEPVLDEFIQARRKEKRIKEQLTEELCRTFVTPLDREDIEALANALYKIPKVAEKFGEKYVLCRAHLQAVSFARQAELLEQSVGTVVQMVGHLRAHTHLEKVKEENDRLHLLEGQADKLMLELVRDLYSGKHDALKVVILLDLYETLERIVDRCRDAGNVVFEIVLKSS